MCSMDILVIIIKLDMMQTDILGAQSFNSKKSFWI